jgi:hypothetical protein
MAIVQWPSSYVSKNLYASGTTGLTGVVSGATPATIAGAIFQSKFVGDSLTARVACTAFTNGLQMLTKWQVLDNDNLTWVDVVDSYNPANVALVTGTGTSGGTASTKFVTAPEALRAGNRPARCVVYGAGSGPGLGLGFDQASIAYDFRAPLVAYSG